MPPRSLNSGGQNPEFIFRDFEGMNLRDAREAIEDNEFYWCENVLPIGHGNLVPLPQCSASLTSVSETGPPLYAMAFNENGTDYAFAVWANSGNAYIVNLTNGSYTTTKIASGLFTSGQTYAVQYSNQGLLIIDPNGYYDWNVTVSGYLTSQNNTLAIATLTYAPSVASGLTLLNYRIDSGAGTGGAAQTVYQVVEARVTTAGSGYAVGDTITLTDVAQTPAQIVVSAINGSGGVTGITLAAGGVYYGPAYGTTAQTGPSGSTTATTGSGTGIVFAVNIQAYQVNIVTPGSGYTSGYVGGDQVFHSGPHPIVDTAIYDITSSGVIGGNAIATYAGRVWIASGRTVYVTDIDSYAAFGGAGTSFTINDSYLHNNITALYSTSNYLYIFGADSIDALSNVTINSGVTSFSRINVVQNNGTITPTSIFSYFRALGFYTASGFYLLSGASAECISDKIIEIIQLIIPEYESGIPAAYGNVINVDDEKCVVFTFNFTDTLSQPGRSFDRFIAAIYYRRKWVVGSFSHGTGSLAPQAVFSVLEQGYMWSGPALYKMFDSTQPNSNWLVKTKLFDGGAPLREKQSINVAVAGTWVTNGGTQATLQVDTELSESLSLNIQNQPAQYALYTSQLNEGGCQYLGMTLSGSTGMSKISMLALRGKTDRDFLQ